MYFLDKPVTKGIPLFSSSEQKRNEFEARIMMEYLDIKPVHELITVTENGELTEVNSVLNNRHRNHATG